TPVDDVKRCDSHRPNCRCRPNSRISYLSIVLIEIRKCISSLSNLAARSDYSGNDDTNEQSPHLFGLHGKYANRAKVRAAGTVRIGGPVGLALSGTRLI